MEYEIDTDRLRHDLMDYYGTAMFNVSKFAIVELAHVENASDQELIRIAQENEINLQNYIVKNE